MKRLTLLLFASVCCMFGQSSQVTLPQPDCTIIIGSGSTGLTTVNQTVPLSPNAGYNNNSGGCDTWAMSLAVSGFSTVTVALQSAPNVAGVAGSWSTFAGGTIVSPSPNNANPITTSTQAFLWIYGHNPWVRVQLTGATGTGIVTGALFGWRIPSAASTGSGGGGGSSDVVILGNGALLSGQQAVTASAAALATNATKTVCIAAATTNTINVFVGPSGVSSSTGISSIRADRPATTFPTRI
jgi:hypothetical protein